MNDIYFSIIIPVHNREKTLPMCIESILSQTYPNFELIMVDDHSTDNSIKVIKDYQKKDSRIILINQTQGRKGAQQARNTGIYNAHYDWIMFNDSDDTWKNNKIEIEYNKLKELNIDPYAVIYSDCIVYDVETDNQHFWTLPHISPENSFKDLLLTSGPMFQSILCSKKLLSEVNYLDESIPKYQEWDTSLRLARKGKFYHISEPLYVYYIGAEDTMSKNQIKSLIGSCNVINKYKDDIKELHGTKILKKQFAEYYIEVSKNLNLAEASKNDAILQQFEQNLITLFGKNYSHKISSFLIPFKIEKFHKRVVKKIKRTFKLH